MENSNSSLNKLAPKYNSSHNNNYNNIDEAPEESGWTMYLEDFLIQNNNEHGFDSISGGYDHDQSSQISDAGSSVNNFNCNYNYLAKNKADDEEIIHVKLGMNLNKGYCKKLSFKKRKTIEANLVDDSLEDTASSPVNSPKVFSLSKMGMKTKDDYYNNYHNTIFFEDKETRNSMEKDYQRSINEQSESTELKKRGLCLVPLSMIVNYIG